MRPAQVHGRAGVLSMANAELDASRGLLVTGPARAGVTAFLETLIASRDRPVVLRSTGRGELREVLYRALCGQVSREHGVDRATRAVRTRLAVNASPDPADEFVAVCARVVADRPVLVALDDVHLCAEPDALPPLVRDLLTAGAEVVLTARPDLGAAPASLGTLALPDIDEDAVAALVRDRLGAAPDRALVAEVCRLSACRAGAAHDAAGLLRPVAVTVVDGHAFLTADARPPLRLPEHHSLLTQFGALPADTRQAILRLALGETLPPEEVPSLKAARVAGILDGQGARPRLAVPLLGEALSGRLGPVHRTRLGGRARTAPAPPGQETVLIDTVRAMLNARDPADAAPITARLAGGPWASGPVARLMSEVDGDVRAAGRWPDIAAAAAAGWDRLGHVHPVAPHARIALLGCRLGATIRGQGLLAAQAVLAGVSNHIDPELARLATATLLVYAGDYRQAAGQLHGYPQDFSTPGSEGALALRTLLVRRYHTPTGTPVGADPAAAVLAHFHAGRWQSALELARRTEAFLTGTHCDAPTLHRVVAAEIARHQGRVTSAQQWLRLDHGMPVFGHLRSWSEAGLWSSLGEHDAARSAIATAITLAEDEDTPVTRALLLGRKARIEHAAGDAVSARETTDTLTDIAQREPEGRNRFEHLRTEAVVLGDTAAATEAMSLAERAGAPPDLARAHLAAAACGLSPVDHLTAALGILDDLGATHTRARVAAALRRLGHRASPEPREADGRTPTERVLTELIADGYPNVTIAYLLAVSDKRVEALIHHQFRRAGVSGRVAFAQQQHATARPR